MKRRKLLAWVTPVVVTVTLPAHAYLSVGDWEPPSRPVPLPLPGQEPGPPPDKCLAIGVCDGGENG